MFAELMKAVEKSQAELLEVVEMGQRAAELRSQAFIRELQTEISELKQRCSNLNQLTQSQDHLTFFKVSFEFRLKLFQLLIVKKLLHIFLNSLTRQRQLYCSFCILYSNM